MYFEIMNESVNVSELLLRVRNIVWGLLSLTTLGELCDALPNVFVPFFQKHLSLTRLM